MGEQMLRIVPDRVNLYNGFLFPVLSDPKFCMLPLFSFGKHLSLFLLLVFAGFFYFFNESSQLEFDPNAKKVTHTLKSNSWFNC